MGPALQKKHK